MEKLIIIGCGAAGMTAALYAARANLNPLVIAGPLPGGLLTQTSDVENYPGFPEAVNGYELMFKFQQQAETPLPRNFFSDSSPSQRGEAPVAMMSA